MKSKNDESMTRRGFVAGISIAAGVATGLALPSAAAAAEGLGVAERINAIANELEHAGARLDRIESVFANPPNDRPEIVDALARLR